VINENFNGMIPSVENYKKNPLYTKKSGTYGGLRRHVLMYAARRVRSKNFDMF